jgi:hypothetical protein
MPTQTRALSALAALALTLPQAGGALAHDRDGLLPAPPAHAPAGVCYAHVSAPAEYGPPPAPGAHWRLNPPPPGAPGPVWCLVVDPAAPPPLLAPERDGWVRVLCDADATPARLRRLQRRLRAEGDYAGELSGRYDAATGAAVRRFQARRHIAHGGYLSLGTVEALEGGATSAYAATFSVAAAPAPVIPPPPPPVVVLPAPHCCAPSGPAGRWLSWPGKRVF